MYEYSFTSFFEIFPDRFSEVSEIRKNSQKFPVNVECFFGVNTVLHSENLFFYGCKA